MAFGVVLSFCSRSTSPTSSSSQYQLDRSPRSRPIVSFGWEKFFVAFPLAVLTFFIAGLLYLLGLEHIDNLGAYSIPSETGLLIPSGYNSYLVTTNCGLLLSVPDGVITETMPLVAPSRYLGK
jgi:hypothetical protein